MNQKEQIAQCNEIEEWFGQVNSLLGTEFSADKQGRREVTEYISLLLSCDAFESVWLKGNCYPEAGAAYLDGVQKLHLVKETQNNLCQLLLPDAEPSDTAAVSEQLVCDREKMQSLFTEFQDLYQQAMAKGLAAEELETETARKRTKESLRQESEILKYTIEFVEEGCGLLERKPQQNDSDLLCMEELIRLLCSSVQIPGNWITESRYNALVRFCLHQKQLFEKAGKIQEELAADWNPDIYRLDIRELEERFNRDYTSMIKRLSRQYRQDHELMESLRAYPGENVLDSDIIHMLDQLHKYQSYVNEFRRNDAEAKRLYGSLYKGTQTDWNTLENLLNEGKMFNDFYMKYGIPENLLRICCSSPEERRKFRIREMSAEYLEEKQIISSLRNVTAIYRGRNFVRCYKAIRMQWKAFESFLSVLQTMEDCMIRDISAFTGIACRFDVLPDVSLLQEYMDRYIAACDTVLNYRTFEPKLQVCFPGLYTGMNSEWEKMYYSWKHGKRICEYAGEKPIPEQSMLLLKMPLEERQNCRIGERSLMDLAFGNGRRDYVEFFNQYPQNIAITLQELQAKEEESGQ